MATAATVDARAAGPNDLAPVGFADAVFERIALMNGGEPTQATGPVPFANLQSAVISAMLAGGGWPPFYTNQPVWVDPETGDAWDSTKLLQQASGRSTWLPDGTPAAAREKQITEALQTISWRVASLGAPTYTLGKSAQAPLAQGCTVSNLVGSPTQALYQKFLDLYTQAQGAAPTADVGAMTDATWFASTGIAKVVFGRAFERADLPRAGQSGAPLPGVPIDDAKVAVFLRILPGARGLGTGSVTAYPVAAGWQPAAGDWSAGGAALGSLSAGAPGDWTSIVKMPPSDLLAPGATLAKAAFRPALALRFQWQEPPPAWLKISDLNCGVGDNAGSSVYWPASTEVSLVRIVYHEAFPPLQTGPVTLHVGTAQVLLTERLRRLAAQLKSEVEAVQSQRDAIEQAVPAQTAALQQAQAAYGALDGKEAPLLADIDQTKKLLASVATAEQALPPAVRAERDTRDLLEQTTARLQDQIVQAESAGNAASAQQLRQQLAREQAQLARVDASLSGRDPAVEEYVSEYVNRLRALQAQVFSVRSERAKARRAVAAADEQLKATLGRRAALDGRLLALAQQLETFDFSIDGLTVTADGKPVYRADLTRPFLRLQEIDNGLAALRPTLENLARKRQAARTDFLSYERLSSDALANVASVIQRNSWIKAGIDTLDYGYDVLKGFAQGGPLGALGAALKKGWEGWIQMAMDDSPTGAPELNADYRVKLKDAFATTAQKAVDTAFSRLVKDTFSKPAKDDLLQGIQTALNSLVFKNVYGPFAPLHGGGGPAAGRVDAAVQSVVTRAKTFLKWADSREQRNLNLLKGPKAPKLNDLLAGLAKDLAKAVAKQYLDLVETRAWTDYFLKEAEAQGMLPILVDASNEYWQAYDLQQSLEQEKTGLLLGYDPATHVRTTLDKQFSSKAKLEVTVDVTRPAGTKGTVDLGVAVGGKQAAARGGYRFALAAAGLQASAAGAGLEISVR